MNYSKDHIMEVHFEELFPGASTTSDLSILDWAGDSRKRKALPYAMEVLAESSAEWREEPFAQVFSESPNPPLNPNNNYAQPTSVFQPLTPEHEVSPFESRRYGRIIESSETLTGTINERPPTNCINDSSNSICNINSWADQFVNQYAPPKLDCDIGLRIKSSPSSLHSPSKGQLIASKVGGVPEPMMFTTNVESGTVLWFNRPRPAPTYGCKFPESENTRDGCENENGSGNCIEQLQGRSLPVQTKMSKVHRVRKKWSSIRRNLQTNRLREALEDSSLTRVVCDLADRVSHELGFNHMFYPSHPSPLAMGYHNSTDYIETELETCIRLKITRERTRGQTWEQSAAITNDIRSIKEHLHRAILASWRFDSTREQKDSIEMNKGYSLASKILWRHNLLCSFNLRPSLQLLLEEFRRQHGNQNALNELNSEIINQIKQGLFELRVQCNVTGDWY